MIDKNDKYNLSRLRLDYADGGRVYIGIDDGNSECENVPIGGPIRGFTLGFTGNLIQGLYLTYEDDPGGCYYYTGSEYFTLPTQIEVEPYSS